MCEAGQAQVNHSVLHYATSSRQLITGAGNINAYYFQSYRDYIELPMVKICEVSITDSLTNGIAK